MAHEQRKMQNKTHPDEETSEKKWKRSERLAALALQLSRQPNHLVTLTELAAQYGCAKSTLSEDIRELRDTLYEQGLGWIETVPGAGGGACYRPWQPMHYHHALARRCCEQLSEPERIMPGGFLYTLDITSDTSLLRPLGVLLAQPFAQGRPDAVLTIEAKGVPVGLMAAEALGVPLVIAQKENRPTEGSVVTLNYQTSAGGTLRSMSLPRRALQGGKRVLIVDDFVKGGGTVSALCDMMDEFSCEVLGVAALIAAPGVRAANGMPIRAPLILNRVDRAARCVDLQVAAWLAE